MTDPTDPTARADPTAATALIASARRLDAAGDYAAAEAAYADALEHVGDTPADAADRARAHAGLAALCRYAGRLDEAASHIRDAAADANRTDDVAVRVEVSAEAALVDLDLGRPDAAARDAGAAVTAATALPQGRLRDAMLALALQRRAAVARERGAYRDAEGDLRQAQRYARTGYGPESFEIAGILSDLGVLYKFSGEFMKSTVAHERAYGIVMRLGGPTHPDLGTIEHNIGGLEFSRGNLAAAEMHARRSVDLHVASLGDEHTTTALDRIALAAILDRLGRRVEARDHLRRALPTIEARLGPDHREVAVALNNLAAIAHQEGDLDEAERAYERALAIKERTVGARSPSVANTLVNLAGVRRAQGRPDEAVALLRRAIDILQGSVAADHPTLVVARKGLARAVADVERTSGSTTLSEG